MKITILTLFPEMVEPFFSSSIMKRAVERKIIEYEIVNFRSYSSGAYNKVDDLPYGGGAGMVLMPEPLEKAILDKRSSKSRIIFPSPSGRLFTQEIASELSREEDLLFICGHYEGMDQRIIEHYVDDELSIGDYVLTSGESASVVIIDALFRLIDGVISKDSLEDESFQSSLLEYDQYTRPERYCNSSVPSVLLSGNHALICSWRDDNRIAKTMRSRPDMLSEASLSLRMRRKLIKIIEEFGIEDL